MKRIVLGVAITMGLAALAACQQQPQPAAPAASTDFQKVLIERLLDAKPGDVIEIPAGRHAFDRSLTLRVNGVTIRGAGMDKTILSFKDQKAGAEGLLVNAGDFTLENLAIEDAKGDGLKINEGANITIRGVRVEWTGGPKTSNGAYGIYPVQTTNVLIEDSVAIGASDAGIYVGQSKNVVVRRNRAERNVAGIEIENTIGADVYENTATQNTGGILVFNMPNLPQPGHTTRVYRNKVFENNTDNFAAKGAAVASVPAGSGIVINSNDQVEIFDNDIADNQTANVIVSSYFSTGYMTDKGVAKTFDPYPEEIAIHGNRFKGGGDRPDGFDLKALKVAMFGLNGRLPDVLWDGYVNAQRAGGPQVCIDNGQAQTLNADGPNKYKNPSVVTDKVRCTLPPLPVVTLPSEAAATTAKAAPSA
ncbi:parallel beta-helix domain-containing protein [Lysobacter auxotrophicus]|uniref:Right-handed parallel beta-helix repeat-containing protein n=1 Tax=Lysobacter auxotrophicus TaxID=2992573 RepID=A0ABM8DH50_9GAMM|nr:parallel beta-helix domain-containing protein [Lysobacter auxotrophicus]BDU17950.1 right-handed parallel beta-helix repeat-containing protein [Lysobacter auxotrophicus]